MIVVSSSAAARTTSAASFTSCRARSLPPEIASRIPRADRTSWSISGLLIAWVAASCARCEPVAMPIPIIALPALGMIVRTSAKSRLMSPGQRDQVADPLDALAQHVVGDPERLDQARALLEHVQEPVVGDHDHRVGGVPQRLHAGRACVLRRLPSNPNGDVTMATVSAPTSRAIRATTGAAPVPVPPPSPAVTNTMSEPRRAVLMRS